MSKTPEGKRKDAVKAWLKEIGAYYFMAVQTGYGKKTLDFLCCYKGRFFAIETKGVDRDFKPHQALLAEEIGAAGGVAFLVLDDESLERAKQYVHQYWSGT